MKPRVDDRVPVIFGSVEQAGCEAALLLEGEGTPGWGRAWFQPDLPSAHPTGCTCCKRRSGAGMALAKLLFERGRGTGPFFRGIVVVATTQRGRDAVFAALTDDPVASSVCRIVPAAQPAATETPCEGVYPATEPG